MFPVEAIGYLELRTGPLASFCFHLLLHWRHLFLFPKHKPCITADCWPRRLTHAIQESFHCSNPKPHILPYWLHLHHCLLTLSASVPLHFHCSQRTLSYLRSLVAALSFGWKFLAFGRWVVVCIAIQSSAPIASFALLSLFLHSQVLSLINAYVSPEGTVSQWNHLYVYFIVLHCGHCALPDRLAQGEGHVSHRSSWTKTRWVLHPVT